MHLVRWSPDEIRLVSLAVHDGTDLASNPGDELTLWSAGSEGGLTRTRSIDTYGRYHWPATWTPDGDRVVIADDDGVSEWWVDDEPSTTNVIDVEGPTDLEFSPDGHLLAVAGDQAVTVGTSDWQPGLAASGRHVHVVVARRKVLATASDAVVDWDVATRTQLGAPVLITPRDQVSEMAWATTAPISR